MSLCYVKDKLGIPGAFIIGMDSLDWVAPAVIVAWGIVPNIVFFCLSGNNTNVFLLDYTSLG